MGLMANPPAVMDNLAPVMDTIRRLMANHRPLIDKPIPSTPTRHANVRLQQSFPFVRPSPENVHAAGAGRGNVP